jgi:hypothetical protein
MHFGCITHVCATGPKSLSRSAKHTSCVYLLVSSVKLLVLIPIVDHLHLAALLLSLMLVEHLPLLALPPLPI